MYICLCRAVTENDVRSVVAQGVRDVSQVVERCGAGTRCGGCRDALREVLATCGILVEPCPLSTCGPAAAGASAASATSTTITAGITTGTTTGRVQADEG